VKLRSLLFVPGDSERKLEKARDCDADALILDLEDSVAPTKKVDARMLVARAIDDPATRDWRLIVRINALDSGHALADLAAVVKPGLDAVMVPKALGGDDLTRVGHYLEALEFLAGMAPGVVKLVALVTETPAALFTLSSYTPAHPRLIALTWGAEDLSAVIGATQTREADGDWTFPYKLARANCLFAAAAAEAAALDTVYVNFRDAEGFERDCRRSRRDGFRGRLAIHPDQVPLINRAYAPTEAELAFARRIVDAFAANPEAGAIGIDGKMIDWPHLKAAKKTLASI
jgi:citrate lyase subunit beta / citryl-CoA lyase